MSKIISAHVENYFFKCLILFQACADEGDVPALGESVEDELLRISGLR